MKKLALLLLAAACSKTAATKPPVIASFTVDNANPQQGDSVTFSWSVTDATSLVLFPEPGAVTGASIVVQPTVDGQFTLGATNAAGTAQATVTLKFAPTPPVTISRFSAVPAQGAPGTVVTLSWTVSAAVSATLSDGSGAAPIDALAVSSLMVHPTATTVYTLTAQAKAGHTPASATAKAVARVAPATKISSFTATPSAILQGDAVTLSWSGNASSWSVTDGTTTTQLGPLRSLVVRPASTTTYTLHASGPGGSDSKTAPVTVTAQAGQTLAYTEPAPDSRPLKLTAAGGPGCSGTSCTLLLVAQAATSLRGVALDLPIDATKVSLSASSTSLGAPTPAFKAALGSGPLLGTLVVGAALEGSGTAPAADQSFLAGAEVARFTLTLVPAGGRGPVFDGAAMGIASWLQSSARSANVIAVGKLNAN